MFIMVSEGVFRGHANTRAPANAALSAAVANSILDPILMFPARMGIAGAAGATAMAQYLAASIYGTMLWRGARRGTMCVPFFFQKSRRTRRPKDDGESVRALALLGTILSANAAMLLRTVSLMSCWALATAVATRMSAAAVGAHQVTLSLWLLFALVAEAPSIAAQVLGARYLSQGRLETARAMGCRVVSLTLGCSLGLGGLLLASGGVVPKWFTSDPELLRRLGNLVPLLAVLQPLVALTLVTEGLLVGAGQFRWLATSTTVTSALSIWFMLWMGKHAPAWGVIGLWGGITGMFIGRLLGALFRILDQKSGPYWVGLAGCPPKGDDGGKVSEG
ncbi:unnamed protein product [Choristocarpus tenellus]